MKNEETGEENKKLIIWINGEKVDSSFEIKISNSVNSIERLKNLILSNYLKNKYRKTEKTTIYSYNGLELDDADINYLENYQTLYLSLDGSPFNVLNYIYEHEFIKLIKEGGYGKVFLARHVLNKDLFVAIKKINITNLTTDEIYNISREALYLQSFKHRNIIKFRNNFIHNENFYTVMDFAKGGELNAYLYEKKLLSEKEAKTIFKQIHEALSYIHSKNVIHRDIKPNNILFLDENRENVVIIDFGISGYNSGNVKEVVKAGTVKFMPPEFISGISYNSSPKFDVWSLGILLYFMLFGQLPFDDASENKVMEKIVKEKIKFPNDIKVSECAIKLLNKMLIKSEALRIEMNNKTFEEWYNDTNASDKVVFQGNRASRDNVKKFTMKVLQGMGSVSPIKNKSFCNINTEEDDPKIRSSSHLKKMNSDNVIKKSEGLIFKSNINFNKSSKSPKKIKLFISNKTNLNEKISNFNLNLKSNNSYKTKETLITNNNKNLKQETHLNITSKKK